MVILEWIGIFLCLLHSGIFSGLNLGFFGLSRLRLEIQAEANDQGARRILSLRKDAHLLLATILWGNVCSNVLLTLLTNSIFTGAAVFLFSTFGITFFGEIIPQAYFSRHALRTSHFLVPIVQFYQILFFPIAKPTAYCLDVLLGKEQVQYFRENELVIMLSRQARSGQSDLSLTESLGAINFLNIDDITLENEGNEVDPQSVIALSTCGGFPVFPQFTSDPADPFLQQIHSSGKKWVIIVDLNQQPVIAINAYHFLKDIFSGQQKVNIRNYCHQPIIVTTQGARLGQVITKFKVDPVSPEDDVIDHDLILYWTKQKRIITGTDILGRLLRGISQRKIL